MASIKIKTSKERGILQLLLSQIRQPLKTDIYPTFATYVTFKSRKDSPKNVVCWHHLIK